MISNRKYFVFFRACDKVESSHKASRPYGLNKLDIIKLSFYSLHKALSGYENSICVIGDDLSTESLNFFSKFTNVRVENYNLGNASKSLKRQIDLAKQVKEYGWIYMCEDDYLHLPYCFNYIDEFLNNRKDYLRTSAKKKNYINRLIGDLSNVPTIIHPPDYPDRYEPPWKRPSYIFKSKYCHWRQITNTTHSLLLSTSSFSKFYNSIYESSHGPSDSKLSENVYGRFSFRNKALCVSPILGLSTHLTDGVMTPFVDWSKIIETLMEEMENLGML